MRKASPSPYYLRLLKSHFERLHGQPLHRFTLASYAPAPGGLEETGGVYVIYDQNKVIYVGQSRNLRRRVWGQHKSGRTSGDQFNIYLRDKKKLRTQEQRQQYLRTRCTFRFLPSDEMASDLRVRNLVEAFLVAELDPALNSKEP